MSAKDFDSRYRLTLPTYGRIKDTEQMADKKEKVVAEKKITISDLAAAVKELDNFEAIEQGITDGLVVAEIDTVDVDAGKYSGDYVKLTLGPNATDESSILKAMLILAGGNLLPPVKEGSEDVDKREPSVVKWFLYGQDLASRSRTSQRIKAAAEGPDKAIESIVKTLRKNKPGLSEEKAREMARMLLED